MGLGHFEYLDISRDPNLATDVTVADGGYFLNMFADCLSVQFRRVYHVDNLQIGRF